VHYHCFEGTQQLTYLGVADPDSDTVSLYHEWCQFRYRCCSFSPHL